MACCIPAPPAEHLAQGKEEIWDSVPVYVKEPSEGSSLGSAVVLVPDIFGWRTPLLRKLVDKIAATGFLVVVPDLFNGDAFVGDPSNTIQNWLPKHPPEPAVENTKKLINILHSKGIDHIGVAGFCWGAKVAVILAQGSDVASGVLCHPSFVSVDDVKNVRQPLAILAAETDHLTPVKLAMDFKEILDQGNTDSMVKIYPGTSHGWTVRYDVSDESAVKCADEAHVDLINWFKKTLKTLS